MPIGCEIGYGDPSGHTMSAVGRALLMWLDYNASNKEGIFSNKWAKIILLLIAIGFGFCASYSKLYLGLHSIDQIIFGTLLGLWFDWTMHFVLREDLRDNITSLLNNKYNKQQSSIFLTVLIIYITLIVITLSVYAMNVYLTQFN